MSSSFYLPVAGRCFCGASTSVCGCAAAGRAVAAAIAAAAAAGAVSGSVVGANAGRAAFAAAMLPAPVVVLVGPPSAASRRVSSAVRYGRSFVRLAVGGWAIGAGDVAMLRAAYSAGRKAGVSAARLAALARVGGLVASLLVV